jgi:uncharacterized membrane protein YdcZ (DUF606 family)
MNVGVPTSWVAQNHLPPVCARHGVPATKAEKRTFATAPPRWSYLLIVLGVLIFLIVVLATRTKVDTNLPACEQCGKDRKRFWVYVAVAGAVSVAVFATGAAIPSDGLTLLGFFLLLATLILACLRDRFRVSGTMSRDRAWVNLKGIHEKFAAEISGALAAPPPSTVPSGPIQPDPAVLPGGPDLREPEPRNPA